MINWNIILGVGIGTAIAVLGFGCSVESAIVGNGIVIPVMHMVLK